MGDTDKTAEDAALRWEGCANCSASCSGAPACIVAVSAQAQVVEYFIEDAQIQNHNALHDACMPLFYTVAKGAVRPVDTGVILASLAHCLAS